LTLVERKETKVERREGFGRQKRERHTKKDEDRKKGRKAWKNE